MNRLAPLVILCSVTALMVAYGRSGWSWLAGPVAAILLWWLERKSREPAEPSAARAVRRNDVAPVD